MAKSQDRSGSHRLVALTPEAEDDLLLTYLSTQQRWGTVQANNYDDLLAGAMQMIADTPKIVPLIENLDGVRKYLVRWKSAQDGHYLFFEETDDGILILRILHSSMNWPDHLG